MCQWKVCVTTGYNRFRWLCILAETKPAALVKFRLGYIRPRFNLPSRIRPCGTCSTPLVQTSEACTNGQFVSNLSATESLGRPQMSKGILVAWGLYSDHPVVSVPMHAPKCQQIGTDRTIRVLGQAQIPVLRRSPLSHRRYSLG